MSKIRLVVDLEAYDKEDLNSLYPILAVDTKLGDQFGIQLHLQPGEK